MKKLIFYIPALILFAVSCEKEENSPFQTENEPVSEVKMITEVVSGGRGESTKATIANSNASFAWAVGDNVAVHVSNGDSHKYVVTSSGASAAAASANFEVTYEDGYSRDAFAVYPSTIVSENAANYGQSGQPLDVTLPSSYTLDQVSGETSPCPMIATNTPGNGWEFYQLCGLLRLTVDGIPSNAKRLEIDFNGKKVCGDFSIAYPVTPNASAIETSADDDHDCITITKDGTNTTFEATSLVMNLPLPVGTYTKITVMAYDALTDGALLKAASVSFGYNATTEYATKKTTALVDPYSTFNFTFKNNSTILENVRFARVFSVKNKLYNGATTYGPYTASGGTNLASPLTAGLRFDKVSGDQLVFQVITGDGKVYSGIYAAAPAEGFDPFETYDVTADVNLYTFTVASSDKKVYFSPGDLGVDNGVYSFTEPFTAWNQTSTEMTTKSTPTSKRTWFIRSEVQDGQTVCGIPWGILAIQEWKYLVGLNSGRIIDNGNVSLYYKVHINTQELGDRYWCYLLPPDQASYENDIKDDLRNTKAGTDYYEVTNYLKYLAKGFVLLMDTERSYKLYDGGNWTYKSRTDSHAGYYHAAYVNNSKSYMSFESGGPNHNAPGNGSDHRIHARYIYTP